MAEKTMYVRLQHRYDTEENWLKVADTDVPLVGEICVTTDGDNEGRFKIGNGRSTWKQLSYYGAADGKSTEIVDGKMTIKGIANAKAGDQLVIGANGDAEWVTPSTETVDGLRTAVSTLREDVDKLNGTVDEDGSVKKTAKDAVDTLDNALHAVAKSGAATDVVVADTTGNLTATNVEDAIAELVSMIGNKSVSVETSDSSEYAKVYTLKQGGAEIGTINIPKDLVVESGVVRTLEEETDGHAAGTYIVLTLANATSDTIWVPVDALIEYVTSGSQTGDMVVVSVSADHKVTATITDGSVSKVKLTSDVQESLNKADSAMQSISIMGETLTNGGELTVDQAKSALGLGSAAYKDETAFATPDDVADVKSDLIGTADDAAEADTIYGAKAHANGLVDALATIASTGNVNDLVQTPGDVLVLCGGTASTFSVPAAT